MPRLYNTKTRQSEVLPYDQIPDAILSGSHSYRANDLIPVISPEGDAGTIQATELVPALKNGFKLESPEQSSVREAVAENRNLSGSAKVALKSFGNQLMFGALDPLLNADKSPLERLKDEAIKNDHDIANAIGGATGFGASLFVGAPVFKGAELVGQGAERIIAKQLADYGLKRGSESVAKDLATRIATNAGRLSTEAVTLAAPKAATEAIVGDPDLAAETLISNGLFGLGLGAVGGVVSTGASRAKKLIDKFAASTEDIAKMAGPKATREDSVVAALSKRNPDDLAYSKINIKRMENAPSLDEAAQNSLPKQVTEDWEKFQGMLDKKEKLVGSILDKAEIKVNTKEISDQIDNIIARVKSEGIDVTEQGQAAISRLEGYKQRLVPTELVAKEVPVTKIVKNADGKMVESTTMELQRVPVPKYRDMTGKEIRKFVQGLRKDNKAWNKPIGAGITESEQSVMNLSESMSERLKDLVGPKYRKEMSEYADMVRTATAFEKQTRVNNWFQNRFKKPIQDKVLGGQASELKINPEQVSWIKTINDLGKYVGKDYETMVKDRLIFARVFPQKAMKGDAETLTSKITDLVNKVDVSKPLQTAGAVLNATGLGTESLLKYYVSNGSIIKSAEKSINKIMTIPEKISGLIGKHVPVSLETTSVGAMGRFLGHDAPKDRKEQLKEINKKASEFNQNPAMAAEHMAQVADGLQPTIADAVTAKNMLIAQYIGETIPKPKSLPSPFNRYEWEPTDRELAQFERRIHAINDPMSVIDDMESGTVTREAIDAVKNVYPKLFELIQNKVVEAMEDNKDPVPYSARIKLSLLMDEPFDPSLEPKAIARYQKNYTTEPEQPMPGKPVNMPSLETDTQRISNN